MQFSKLGLSVIFALTLSACSGNVPTPPPQPSPQQAQQPAAGQQNGAPVVKPAPLPKEFTQDVPREAPFAQADQNRALYRYYQYLIRSGGLKLNPPREFFPRNKAEDVLQFTMDEPTNMVVLVAKFKDAAAQEENNKLFDALNQDGRKKIVTESRYTLLIKGGNEQLHKLLVDALENYDKKS